MPKVACTTAENDWLLPERTRRIGFFMQTCSLKGGDGSAGEIRIISIIIIIIIIISSSRPPAPLFYIFVLCIAVVLLLQLLPLLLLFLPHGFSVSLFGVAVNRI